MREIMGLAGRNLKIYLRDRGAVFFSLLSAIIVIVLMLVFLGDMNVQSISSALDEMHVGTPDENLENAKQLIIMWAMGGILCVNGVTVSSMVMSTMINDFTNGKIQAFRTAPISRIKLSLGYIISAWAASSFICVLTLAAADILGAVNGTPLPDIADHLLLIAMILVNCFTYSGIMYFAGLLIKTAGAWSGFATLISTLVGFLGAIYIPMGSLPEGVQTVLKCLPVLHGCSMFRSVLTKPISEVAFEGAPQQFITECNREMGTTVVFGDNEISPMIQLAILLICGIIFIAAATLISRKRFKSDR